MFLEHIFVSWEVDTYMNYNWKSHWDSRAMNEQPPRNKILLCAQRALP